jgi:hypothetical protein
MGDQEKRFDKAVLEAAFNELGRRAHALGRTIEIAVYGGAALLLTLNQRVATKDVDGVFDRDKDFVKKLAAEMAEEFNWDQNWLNDGVKGWLSESDSDPDVKKLFKTYPSENEPGLRVFIPKPEYMFAMKCRAMRVGGVDGSSDIDDIKDLAQELGITNIEQALAIVEGFYPANLLEPKTRLGLEEILSSFNYKQS